jgi:integrase
MAEKRTRVWIQRFKDRRSLVLQWIDPDTGKRKSKSAETADPEKAKEKRADLESDLNHGRHKETSRMSWERFRKAFEDEYLPGCRPDTRRNYEATFDLFEAICNPQSLRGINERTISLFVSGMRKRPGRRLGTPSMMPSTIKVRLQFVHTALSWAVKQKMTHQVPEFPNISPPEKDPQPVPAEAFEKVLAKAPDAETKAYLLCGWQAGLRLREAFFLEWEPSDQFPYVDFLRQRIILPAGFTKAKKDQWVPLDQELRKALESLPRIDSKVFHFRDGRNVPLTVGGVSQRIADLASRAGVKMTMKTLRQGFGSRYAKKVSTHVLQKLMRHANIKTTLRYYTALDDAVEEAVLGAECNTLRNRCASKGSCEDSLNDASAVEETTNSLSANEIPAR